MSTHLSSAALGSAGPSPSRERTRQPAGSPPRRRLSAVPRTRRRAPRVPFVLLVVTLLTAGLIGLLVLNTSMQRGAYVATSLREQSAGLDLRQQQLSMQVAERGSPRRVAERAISLGMVQNNSPAFLSLADGSVIGRAVAGKGGDQAQIGSAPGLGLHSSKRSQLPAGTATSVTTGAILVPEPKKATHGRGSDDGATKPGDTR